MSKDLTPTERLDRAVKGDDYPGYEGDRIPNAGIHLPDHGNAIEFHATTLEEAQALRDEALKRILDSRHAAWD